MKSAKYRKSQHFRGRDRSEHGAKRSKADSPTATAGSRAAQIKNKS